MISIKLKFLSVFLLLITACVHGNEKRKIEVYKGQKIIFFGKNVDFKYFGKVLSDWEQIHEAIYKYMPENCIKNKLTIDLIESFDISPSTKVDEIVFTLGTTDPCNTDSSSSGPSWHISEKTGVYQVIDYSLIQE